ncbi:MAG: FliI/YscN family ATPase [Treponema sp.]|jgi:flagellum-specific ATP synthase|nr:FliI/YscN family ATPase [Treponema sp.]
MGKLFAKYMETVQKTDTIKFVGHVFRVQGLLVESVGPQSVVGELCAIETRGSVLLAEVTGLNGSTVQLMVYGSTDGIELGARVVASGNGLEIPCSPDMLGHILDAQGRPLDGGKGFTATERVPAIREAPPAFSRPMITERLVTGIRAIDGLLAVGKGQRIGVFAGAGVGKSTFLGMIAASTRADVNVIALIGERGRELNDFVINSLGENTLKHSVVVAATSDKSSLERLKGAYTATAIAEYFRDLGMNVMLLFDSITRFARAQREIGLSRGESPAHRGYPPSVFDLLPKLLERAGVSDKGSITAFYTVLVEGDDMDEPVSDNVRATLDAHIVLSRRLASRGHYPPVDALQSISRLADDVSGPETKKAVRIVKRLMADYAESEDIINAGAYKQGSNPDIDAAIAKRSEIEDFLIQSTGEQATLSETLSRLGKIAGIEIPEAEWISSNKQDLPPSGLNNSNVPVVKFSEDI